MDKGAAEKLGEPIVAEVVVSSKGHLLKMGVSAGIAGGIGGVVGSAAGAAAGRMVGGKAEKAGQLPGDYKGLIYLGLGPTKLGIFSAKRGMLASKADQLLLAVPRSEVETLAVGKGFTAPVTITLKDGTTYTLEVARAFKGKAEKVEQAFNGG